MTTKTDAIRSTLADLDRSAADLIDEQHAAQERQPPQPPALTPDVKRQDADITMCHMFSVWLGWHYEKRSE